MGALFIKLVIHCYRNLLKLYPREFRETFADEMQSVFEEMITSATSQGPMALIRLVLKEFLSTPSVLFRAHQANWQAQFPHTRDVRHRITAFFAFPPPSPRLDGRDSWQQAGWEMIPFLFMGLILILQTYLPLEKSGSGWQRSLGIVAPVLLILPLPVFLYGLLKGLPRWAYPSGGMLLGYWIMIGLMAQLMPFLLVISLAMLGLAIASAWVNFHRHPLPVFLRRLGYSLWVDWTRLSFAIYAATPLLIILAFDDAYINNRTPYLAISTICMSAGALGFIRSHKPFHQILALLVGLSLSIWPAFLDKATFNGGIVSWMVFQQTWSTDAGWMFRLWLIAVVLLLAPAVLGIAKRRLEPG
jgi:hypothetical protein